MEQSTTGGGGCLGSSGTIFISGFATYVSYLAAEAIDPDNLPWGRLLVEETFRVSI